MGDVRTDRHHRKLTTACLTAHTNHAETRHAINAFLPFAPPAPAPLTAFADEPRSSNQADSLSCLRMGQGSPQQEAQARKPPGASPGDLRPTSYSQGWKHQIWARWAKLARHYRAKVTRPRGRSANGFNGHYCQLGCCQLTLHRFPGWSILVWRRDRFTG